MGHIVKARLSCKMSVQQWLLQEGITSFHHISSIEGHILEWPNHALIDLNPTWQRAYTKMVSNLTPISLPDRPVPKRQLVYVASLPLVENSTIWQIKMTRAERLQRWLPSELAISARNVFRYSKGLLSHMFHSGPPRNRVLMQLISAPNTNHAAQQFPIAILSSVFEFVGQTNQYL